MIFGGSLIVLATITLVLSLLQRICFVFVVRWRMPYHNYLHQGRWNIEYARAMLKPSLFAWLAELGNFLMLRTDSYFIAVFKGASNLPSYLAAYQLVSTLNQLATSFAVSSVVFVSQAWHSLDFKTIHQLVRRNAKLGLAIMATGTGFLIITGKEVIDLWLGEGNFIGYGVLWVFCITLTIQTQTAILIQALRATEDDQSFASWNLTAGVLNVMFTALFIKPLGLLGVSLGTLAAQIPTTSWYGLYRSVDRLRINIFLYSRDIGSLWASLLVTSMLLCYLVKQGLFLAHIHSITLIVILSAFLCGALLFIVSWFQILSKEQREKLKSKLPWV